MEQALPIKPSSVDLIRWLFIVAMMIAVCVPCLYESQKHMEIVSGQMTTSVSTQPRQIAPMEPKADPGMGKMLDESIGVKIPPSLREEQEAVDLILSASIFSQWLNLPTLTGRPS